MNRRAKVTRSGTDSSFAIPKQLKRKRRKEWLAFTRIGVWATATLFHLFVSVAAFRNMESAMQSYSGSLLSWESILLTASNDNKNGGAKGKGNIFIAIKTTQSNQDRISSILDTWWNLAPRDIAFFTDSVGNTSTNTTRSMMMTTSSPLLQNPTRDSYNLIDTGCPGGHGFEGLCCKTAAEIQYYYNLISSYNETYGWMCHMDDDTFLNYPALEQYLNNLTDDEGQEQYIGYGSVTVFINKERTKYMKGPNATKSQGVTGMLSAKRGDLVRKEDGTMLMAVAPTSTRYKMGTTHRVMYGTGGAGWCLSRGLVERGISNYTNLPQTCEEIGFSDDYAVGYVSQAELGVKMTKERRLHSHLDDLKFSSREEAMRQITFGASGKIHNSKFYLKNFVQYPGLNISLLPSGANPQEPPAHENDPMCFRTLYCDFWPERCLDSIDSDQVVPMK